MLQEESQAPPPTLFTETPIFSTGRNSILGYSIACPDCNARLLPCESCDQLMAYNTLANQCTNVIHQPAVIAANDLDLPSAFCIHCGCLNVRDDTMRARAGLDSVWPLDERVMIGIQLSVCGEARYLEYKMEQYRVVARVLDTKRRSAKRFGARERGRQKREESKRNAADDEMDSLNSRKEPTYSEGVQLENLEVDPAAPVKKIRKKRKIIQELRAKAKGKGKGDVADGPMQPKLIGTVTPNLKDSRNEKSGVPSAEVSVKPTAPTTSAAPIPPTSPSVKTKKKKRGKRKTERKSDEMDIDTSTASHVEPVPTALPPQQPQPPIQQPESTVDEPKTKKKKKPFNRVRKPRVEAISVAITATISENIEATNIVINIPPLVSAPAHTVPAAIISEPPDVIQQLPLQQPAPMPETTPPAPLISLQPTRKRKLISLETSDDDDEKSEIEIPQNPSTKQQPPTLNPSEPPSKSKKWRSKQRTRIPAKSNLLTTLHNYSVETLETLLWSLRTQLVKIQALEYVPTWRHGQYCLDWWQHRGRVFASGCKFIRGLETVYRVNTQENREVEEGEVEESVVSKSILSLANEVLMDVKPHVRLFRNIRERVVGMDGSTLVTSLILREIETLQETFVEDTRRQVLQKTKVIRSEISRLWREIGLWNDECTSVKELSWKQEVLAVTEMLMKGTGEDSDLQDIKEDFESSLKEEQIRENARVKLFGLLWLYRLWMSSIF